MSDPIREIATEPVAEYIGLSNSQLEALERLLTFVLDEAHAEMTPALESLVRTATMLPLLLAVGHDGDLQQRINALEVLRVTLSVREMCPPELRIAEAQAHMELAEAAMTKVA